MSESEGDQKKGKKDAVIVALEERRKLTANKKRKAYLSPEQRIQELESDVSRLVELALQQQYSISELQDKLKQQGDRLWKLLRLLGKTD
jgi:hypothetical protein